MTSSPSFIIGALLLSACSVVALPPPISPERVAETFRENRKEGDDKATVNNLIAVRAAAMQCADIANAASGAAAVHQSKRHLRASIGGATAIALTAASTSVGVFAFRDDAKSGTQAAFAATATLAVGAIIYALANWLGSEQDYVDRYERATQTLVKAQQDKANRMKELESCLPQNVMSMKVMVPGRI